MSDQPAGYAVYRVFPNDRQRLIGGAIDKADAIAHANHCAAREPGVYVVRAVPLERFGQQVHQAIGSPGLEPEIVDVQGLVVARVRRLYAFDALGNAYASVARANGWEGWYNPISVPTKTGFMGHGCVFNWPVEPQLWNRHMCKEGTNDDEQ